MPLLRSSLLKSKFSLDSSGIAGFFGGEEAFAAMNSIHLIPGRRWLGWYNSPGSYFVAKKYGILPNSTFWDGIFPGPPMEPAELLGMDSKHGPRYTGVYSGTQLHATGHLSHLIARYCNSQPVNEPKNIVNTPAKEDAKVQLQRHREIYITIVDFNQVNEWISYPFVPDHYFKSLSPRGKALIFSTVLFSMCATVLSALFGDWFSFSMILFGAFVNGITLLVLGDGKLCLELTNPSPDSPAGHGFFFDGKHIILVQGTERVVSTILHQKFRLQYDNDPEYYKIGLCSILLLAQFLFQLFLIPQGNLVGQILFISTLAASWICNGYLASFDREDMQTELLFKLLGSKPRTHRIKLDKWSKAVSFAMFYFPSSDSDPEGIINELMPNNTPSWKFWKKTICEATRLGCRPGDLIGDTPQRPQPPVPNTDEAYTSKISSAHKVLTEALRNLPEQDRTFVKNFLREADLEFEHVRTTSIVKFKNDKTGKQGDTSATV